MMQFDWTTFILEIINFLVLMWILQRFLYRPVLTTLDARQKHIKDKIDHAEQLSREAEALHRQYEQKLSDWDKQQESSRRQLDEEFTQLRNKALENLKQTLKDEEAKSRVHNQSLIAAREKALIHEAKSTAYSQVSLMLQRLASAQLTQSIINMFLDDLKHLPDRELTALQKAATMPNTAKCVEMISAHPLKENEQAILTQALSSASGQALQLAFKEDRSLIAGLRAVVGECQLHANLADELAFFNHQANHD